MDLSVEQDAASVVQSPSAMAPPPLPSPRHRFTQSTNDARLNAKRLSLSFSVPGAELWRRQSANSVSPMSSRSVSPARPVPIANDPSQFLTALAAQERRVLELKEELKKAETDLAKLKDQWATHEATKKRNEVVHQAMPMRPLPSPTNVTLHSAPIDEWPRAIGERRQTLQVRPKPTQRRFEGGKHTRALSLLSPDSIASRSNIVQSPVKLSQRPANFLSEVKENWETPNRMSIDPSPKHTRTTESLGRGEDFVNTGKKLVGDLRGGLWAFIEDLKQATVGDEAVSEARAQGLNTPSKTATLKNSPLAVRECEKKTSTAAGSAKLVDAPAKLAGIPKGESTPRLSPTETVNEGWDDWESLPPRTGASIFDETAQSSPRTSMSSETSKEKHLSGAFEQIPWPALSKISPSRLSRTASTLMQEWENSIREPAPSSMEATSR